MKIDKIAALLGVLLVGTVAIQIRKLGKVALALADEKNAAELEKLK